jgi:hypothetical protein
MKAHFLTILVGLDPDFPKLHWDLLLEEIVTPLLSSSISTLVSAVGLFLEPGKRYQTMSWK